MPVNLSNDVYFQLKKMKEHESRSFSEVIAELLHIHKEKQVEKTEGKAEMLEFIRQLETRKPKLKPANYSEQIDKIAYGVSL